MWDWALGTGVFDALRSSGLIRRLEVADLKMLETCLPSWRIAYRGGDPYNLEAL